MVEFKNLVVVHWVNGRLELDHNNLDKILETIKLNPDHELAILSFIGETGSGKTFYTNLLIQNLQNNSTGGWLSQVNGSQCKPLPGFPYSTKKEEDCGNQAFTSSEISLWAEAFPVTNHGKRFMVMVLHANYAKADEKHNVRDCLDLFLTLFSSRIVQLQWKTKEFRLSDIINRLFKKNASLFGGILHNSSMVYLVRTIQKPSAAKTIFVGHEARHHLAKTVTQPDSTQVEFNYPQNVNIAYIYDSSDRLLNTTGSLSLSTEMYHNINAVINLIADDEEILPKKDFRTGEYLERQELKEFMQNCVDFVNDIVGQANEGADSISTQTAEDYAYIDDHMEVEEFSANGNENTFTHIETEEKYNAELHKQCTDKQMKDTSHEMQVDEDENTVIPDENTNPDGNVLVLFVIKNVEENTLKQLRNWEQIDSLPITTILPDFLRGMEQNLNDVLKHIFHKTPNMTQQNREWVSNASMHGLNYFRQELHDIQTLLQSFLGMMRDLSAENGYILEEEFSKLLECMEAKGKIRLIHEESLKYTVRACRWSVFKYKVENRLFYSSLEVLSDCEELIREFYTEEMKRILMDGPYSSSNLLKIHFCITTKCLTALALAVSVEPERLIKFQRNLLCKTFFAVKQSNRRKLQLFQKKVTNMIAKAKENYDQDEKLNVLLENPTFKGMEKAMVQNTHEQARNNAVLFLEERIVRGDIRLNEPVEAHKMTLITVIENYWEDLRQRYMQ